MLLKGTPPGPTTIKLNGLFGTFRIASSPFKINFVSTLANPARGEGHAALVRELKPMRDRLKAADLKDLKSLLQRDLNDSRVARELVPYLKGQGTSSIGFFPAILAVMVPKGYLQDGSIAYPRPIVAEDNPDIVHYDQCWTVEQYSTETKSLPLGMIEIDPDRAEIVVLDGQHRANAFRFLAGDFKPNEGIYKMFYEGVTPAAHLDMDLPVTLIWFESDTGEPINPNTISRRLFVDVNNSAKAVSTSRTILLDDRAVTCIATGAFYDYAAHTNGFAAGRFSLLHGAFDMDSDIADGRLHKFVLTTPEIINHALYWGLFGSYAFDDLPREKVWNEQVQKNRDKFLRIFPDFEDIRTSGDEEERYRRLFLGSPDRAEEFREQFREGYGKVLALLFEEMGLLRPHYQACAAVEGWVRRGNSSQREVWDKVFCGGEGLYWSITRTRSTNSDSSSSLYQTAIREVEQKFSEERARLFEGLTDDDAVPSSVATDVDMIYDSFRTKAFQTGYLGAVEFLARHETTEGDYLVAAVQLVSRLDDYQPTHWRAIFRDLRKLLLTTGLDPKYWPTYRLLLIRLYDPADGNGGNDGQRYFGWDWDSIRISPDWISYRNQLDLAARAYATTFEEAREDGAALELEEEDLRHRAETILNEVRAVLAACNLASTWFGSDLVLNKGVERLRSEITRNTN